MPRSRALSPQALVVVDILASTEGWWHGYDLMSHAGVQSGTLYPLLMRLETQGLLEARWEDSPQPGRPQRHVYRLSAAGRTWVAELASPHRHALAPSSSPDSAPISPARVVKASS